MRKILIKLLQSLLARLDRADRRSVVEKMAATMPKAEYDEKTKVLTIVESGKSRKFVIDDGEEQIPFDLEELIPFDLEELISFDYTREKIEKTRPKFTEAEAEGLVKEAEEILKDVPPKSGSQPWRIKTVKCGMVNGRHLPIKVIYVDGSEVVIELVDPKKIDPYHNRPT